MNSLKRKYSSLKVYFSLTYLETAFVYLDFFVCSWRNLHVLKTLEIKNELLKLFFMLWKHRLSHKINYVYAHNAKAKYLFFCHQLILFF